MSFDLFGPSTKQDIKVGYIDPERGYVGNVSRHEANVYAKLNPGTQFILKTRDKIEYMNINDVNKLTPKDFIPASSAGGKDGCTGITGLDIYGDNGEIAPSAFKDEFPKVLFSGGGGLGAAGNPVFGDDGGLLAVDLIEGGWGYQYAPITNVIDVYGIGAGAVVRPIMIGDPEYSGNSGAGSGTGGSGGDGSGAGGSGGDGSGDGSGGGSPRTGLNQNTGCEFVEIFKTFEREEDFEEYDLTGGSDISFGTRRGVDGEEIGPWDPTIYTTLEGNPAAIEQKKYQDFMESLGRGSKIDTESGIIRNFWTTRSQRPFRVTSENKKSRIVHNVEYPAWSEFMNNYAVSPKPPSNVLGSDHSGIEHSMEWEENFPVDGDYTFRYAADNIADIYLDNELIGRTKRFKESPDKLKKYVSEGVHRIRIDLENLKQFKTEERGPVIVRNEKKFIKTQFEVYGQGREIHRAMKFSFTSEGGEHSFVLNNVDKDRQTYKRDIKILKNTNYKVVAIVDSSQEKSQVKNREYKIEYGNNASPTAGRRVVNKGKTIEFDDNSNNGFDINAKFKITSTSPGISAKFSEDGTKLIVKGQDKGDVSLTFEWDDNPKISGIAVGSITIGGTKWNQSGKKGSETKTVNIKRIINNNSNSGVVEQGTMQSFGTTDKEKGNKPSKIIFSDFVGSANDNDDMQVRVNQGIFTATNKRQISGVGPQGKQTRGTFDITYRVDAKVDSSKSSPSDKEIKSEQIFSTKEFIDKADRKLWRINPKAGRDGDFLSRLGVLPFNPKSNKATTDDYDGTHIIRWEYVDFPISGNYDIETMVDDSATVYIGNRSGGGKKGIGNGLISVDQGGDEVVIRKQGFRRGRSTGKSSDTRFFQAGKYRIRVELKQIKGKPLADGNPMAFAMRILTTAKKEGKVEIPRSWNQNPMGAALTIDSPIPSIPQEPKPQQEGRCPNNPFWSTRFPGSQDKWHPVTHPAWSKFTNRYAMSPIPPLSTPNTDAGGEVFRTTWVVEAPYDGFYGMKGTVDNGGRILVDDRVILKGGLKFNGRTLEGFKSEFPKTVKFPLQEGKHTITVEVTNQEFNSFKSIDQKIFDTKDWVTKPIKTGLFTGCEAPIIYKGLHPRNKKLKVSDDKKKISFSDGDGKFNDAYFTIKSGDAVFSDDGKKLIGTKATLEFKYDEDPFGDNGEALNSVSIGNVTWAKEVIPGDKYSTVAEAFNAGDIRSVSDYAKDIITNRKWRFDGGESLVAPKLYEEALGVFVGFTPRLGSSIYQVDADDPDGGTASLPHNTRRAGTVKKVIDICVESEKDSQNSKKKQITINGVTYVGPTELASYKKGLLSPRFNEINKPTEEIQGKTWIMRWENVNFPQDGEYKIETQVDDKAEIFIDGVKVQTASLSTDNPKIYTKFNTSKGKKTVEIRLSNLRFANTSFQQNPTYVGTSITTVVDKKTKSGKPWTINPIGISAVIIPPPCPLKIKGKGKICKVIVDDPGNGYPAPNLTPDGQVSYPVTIELEGVDVINPGINYNCGVDQLVMEPSNGVRLTYECDTFGRIKKINVLPETPTPGPGSQIPFGRGFTRQPNIRMITDTGVNFQAVPRFRIVRDPVGPDILPEQIIQVTDLVGLKQTGYIDGRPYYGQVFYKRGVRYAGVYETPGQLIQVYDTLQESVDAEVTTPPSAILRQGTDISSNDPRLNIPGTTDSLS